MSAGIVWVEIPVLNMSRALAFYNTLFELQAEVYDDGPWIYLYSEDPLEELLARVEAAGGEVLTPFTLMGEAGSYTAILDTEGNTIALYTLPDGA